MVISNTFWFGDTAGLSPIVHTCGGRWHCRLDIVETSVVLLRGAAKCFVLVVSVNITAVFAKNERDARGDHHRGRSIPAAGLSAS